MKVLFSWLREFVPTTLAPPDLAQTLSLSGTAVERLQELVNGDWLLELDLASNRPDCLSHYGVARELAAASLETLRPLPAPELPAALPDTQSGAHPEPGPKVTIEAPEACGRYCALALTGVSVTDSPLAIAERLNALGHRAINNIADLTNYTMWEMGHPTHAFDADRLRGGELRVRWARAGETLVTLDGLGRELNPDDLVIADAERPVALAGVMGGVDTAITTQTRRVVLESAWFNPLSVRRAARRHKLHTDASHRFERGADPAAAAVAARLIAARARGYGAHVAGITDCAGMLPRQPRMPLRPATLQRILGKAVGAGECERILRALGCTPSPGGEWLAPSWRHDLGREMDLVEEIARLHGYQNFPARLPAFHGSARPLPEAKLRDRVRQQLRGRGFTEAVSLSFAAASECSCFAAAAEPVRVLNPLSEEAAILRTSSLPAMLQLLRNNLNHGNPRPQLYEVGKLYRLDAGAPVEPAVLSMGAARADGTGVEFSDWKGEVEAVLALFATPERTYTPAAVEYLHPGRSAICTPYAVLGQLHPSLALQWKLPEQTWVAEIQLEQLYPLGPSPVRYRPPSRYPASERDFSFIFADSVHWEQIRAGIEAPPAIPHLGAVAPVELFRGAHIGAGQYSLLVRVRFQSDERTLQDAEVQVSADEVAGRLRRLGGTQR